VQAGGQQYVRVVRVLQACYDVRDSSAFWDLMDLRETHVTAEDKRRPPELLSTHPASANRARKLDDWMAKVSHTTRS
jgi:Zn-dependent protease with chaperone function